VAGVRIWLFATAKTPKESVSKLADWFTTAMQAPKVKAKLLDRGVYPAGMGGTDFGVHFRKAYVEYGVLFAIPARSRRYAAAGRCLEIVAVVGFAPVIWSFIIPFRTGTVVARHTTFMLWFAQMIGMPRS
jgi:hypothetical protein